MQHAFHLFMLKRNIGIKTLSKKINHPVVALTQILIQAVIS